MNEELDPEHPAQVALLAFLQGPDFLPILVEQMNRRESLIGTQDFGASITRRAGGEKHSEYEFPFGGYIVRWRLAIESSVARKERDGTCNGKCKPGNYDDACPLHGTGTFTE